MSVLPHLRSGWWKIKVVEQGGDKSRRYNEYAGCRQIPEKRDRVIRFGALNGQGHILAELEKVWVFFTQAQSFPNQVELEWPCSGVCSNSPRTLYPVRCLIRECSQTFSDGAYSRRSAGCRDRPS